MLLDKRAEIFYHFLVDGWYPQGTIKSDRFVAIFAVRRLQESWLLDIKERVGTRSSLMRTGPVW